MKNDPDVIKAIEEVKNVFDLWLDSRVRKPSFETIEKGILEQARVANCLALLGILTKCIHSTDDVIDEKYLAGLHQDELKRRLRQLEKYVAQTEMSSALENEHFPEEILLILKDGLLSKHLWMYLEREIHSVALSIMSTSYISSMILMRSIYELIIGISTRKTGSMKKERIASIDFLTEEEKNKAIKTWDELCAWSHPYGKWENEICPIFNNLYMYHPKHCELCITKLEELIDLLLIVSINRYRVDENDLYGKLEKGDIDISRFSLKSS